MAISDSAQELERAVLSGVAEKNRPYRVKTPLAEDHLTFRSMRFSESISETFEMEVELLSSDPAIDFDAILGHNLTVGLDRPRGGERFFNGYVTRFGFAGLHGRMFMYRATVSPWLWLLKQTENCMIFHELNACEIAQAVFGAHGFSDFRIEVQGSPPIYEYCVQYRESDFNFVSRLFEKEGIYYFFEHENGKHIMVITDSMATHNSDEGYEKIPMVQDDVVAGHLREGIFHWRNRRQICPTEVSLQDYNFTAPRAEMLVTQTISRRHAAAGLKLYQYPGEYKDSSAGEKYAQLRVEEQQSNFEVAYAETNAHGIRAGYHFELEKHAIEKINTKYLVTSTQIECQSASFSSGVEDAASYSCTFSAMPLSGTYRPARVSPKPLIHGPQTAVVTNKTKSEEIEPVDKFGRVTVSFEWEREGNLSCPVRVSQLMAGAGWGAMNIPRHGQEVIVEFEDGNPDRPIITGRVYNGKAELPYDPLEMPTITTFKTSSSKGGGGFNELRFDDKKGEENIFIHAEDSMDTRVKKDRRTYIGRDDHQIVKNDQLFEVKGNKNETIDAEMRLKVKDDISVQSTTGDTYVKSQRNIVLHSTMGDIELKAQGGAVVLDAVRGLTIKCGGSFVSLTPAGVDISGPMVKINSGGSALSGPGEQVVAPDPPDVAKNDNAGEISPAPRSRNYTPTATQLDSHPVSASLINAAASGAPFCRVCAQMAAGGQS